jgi:hypothetical protein
MKDPHLFGIPLNWENTPHGFFYTDDWVLSEAEWIDSVDIGLQVLLDTGFPAWARRTKVDDYIELTLAEDLPETPFDEAQLDDQPAHVEWLAARGADMSVGKRCKNANTLLAWMKTSSSLFDKDPIGQVVIARGSTQDHGEIVLLDLDPDAATTAKVRLVRIASHLAAWEGAATISTLDTTRELDILGFRSRPDGERILDTAFLDLDLAAYYALVESDISAGKWSPIELTRLRDQRTRKPRWDPLKRGLRYRIAQRLHRNRPT